MKNILYPIIFLMTSLALQAQVLDVLQFHIGSGIFPQDEKRDFNTGKPTNLYAGFEQSAALGAGFTKFITDKVQLVGLVENLTALKPNYFLNMTRTNLNLKYSFLSPDIYRFAPYITAGGNASYFILTQSDFSRDYIPDTEYNGGPQGVDYNTITYRENNFEFFTPMFGVNGGLGVDVNIYNKYSVFVEAILDHNFAKQTSIQENYSKVNYELVQNTSELQFVLIRSGLKIYMY